MKKKIILLFFFFSLSVLSFFNFGKFLDVTAEPTKTDLIVSLGSNGVARLEKSISLVQEGYSNYNTIIITGYNGTKESREQNVPDQRLKIIKDNQYKDIKFVINQELNNTAEEVMFVNKFMQKNNFKSVTFVTERPHSRRVLLLANILKNEKESDFTYKVVANDVIYWHTPNFYKNEFAIKYALTEFIKLTYNLVAYGIFYNLGILDIFEKNFKESKAVVLDYIEQ